MVRGDIRATVDDADAQASSASLRETLRRAHGCLGRPLRMGLSDLSGDSRFDDGCGWVAVGFFLFFFFSLSRSRGQGSRGGVRGVVHGRS